METLIFDWESWDVIDTDCNQYYNVQLTRDLSTLDSRLEKGTLFPMAVVNLSDGYLTFYTNEDSITIKLGFVLIKDDKELVIKS